MTTAPINYLLRQIGRYTVPVVFVVGYLVILFHWTTGSGDTLTTSVSAACIALGSLAGLTGAYLALTQLLLQSRLPILEGPFGRAGLVRFHRANGYAVILILLTHFILITTGYALANGVNVFRQDLNFLESFPYVWWASIALALLTSIGFISVTIVRRHLKYESWYVVHLFTYVAILLAFKHQLAVGIDFASRSDQWMRDFWWTIYIFTFAAVLIFRLGRPLFRLALFKFRVERVVAEADNIHSIYVTGHHLERLNFVPGQFAIWRFLDAKRFWQAHPFTISQGPNGKELRLTFKSVGDFTNELVSVEPGTPVLIDGPYGDFTLQDEKAKKVLFIAGGIGLTPLRSMLDTLEKDQTAILLYAVRHSRDIALGRELDALAKIHQLTIYYLTSDETTKGYESGIVDAANLRRLVPDYKAYQIYLCGPPTMMNTVSTMLSAIGVPAESIHTERFAF